MSGDMQQRLEDLHSLQETLQTVTQQQLPSMCDTLDSNVSSLVNKLDNLVSRATSGLCLDPEQNGKEMLVQLKPLCSEFCMIAEQLNDQSRASKILRGHLLDLTFVTVPQQNIEARTGLWELMGMSSSKIQEWKLLKFRKELESFDCSKFTDETIQKLGHITQAPAFQPSSVQDVRRACRWVTAVYKYTWVQRHMAPQKAKKCNLDELMAKSLAWLKVTRLQEESERDRLVELVRQLELNRRDMELLKAQLSTAEAQERERVEAELAKQCITGDALTLAAAVTYLGPFGPDVRQELLQKWHKLCLTGEIQMKQ
ncbi:unnamed protein product [Leuciscus chuanchicus]